MESTTRWTPCQLSRLLHLSQISLQNKKNCVAKCVIGCSCQVQIVFLPQKDVKNLITLARFKNSLSICLIIFFNYSTIFWLFVQRTFCFMLRILNSKRVLIHKISRKRIVTNIFRCFGKCYGHVYKFLLRQTCWCSSSDIYFLVFDFSKR